MCPEKNTRERWLLDAVPVSAHDLREGEVYFTVQFADEKLLVPVVGSLIFVGRNLEKGDSDALYFQKFKSYSQGVRYNLSSKKNMTDFRIRGPEETKHLRRLRAPSGRAYEMFIEAPAPVTAREIWAQVWEQNPAKHHEKP